MRDGVDVEKQNMIRQSYWHTVFDFWREARLLLIFTSEVFSALRKSAFSLPKSPQDRSGKAQITSRKLTTPPTRCSAARSRSPTASWNLPFIRTERLALPRLGSSGGDLAEDKAPATHPLAEKDACLALRRNPGEDQTFRARCERGAQGHSLPMCCRSEAVVPLSGRAVRGEL